MLNHSLFASDREVYTSLKAKLEDIVDAGEVTEDCLNDYLLSVRKLHKEGYITMDDLIELYTEASRYIY